MTCSVSQSSITRAGTGFGFGLGLLLLAAACDGGAEDGGVSFDECIASVEPVCTISAMDTADKLETACFDLENITIPLADGGEYGPEIIAGGPYGGMIEWNEGADTEFVTDVNPSEPLCLPIGVRTFMEPEVVNEQILNTRDIDYSLYTIFRPACMKEGETYPVITWANGTCGLTHGYAPLLGTIASHGFVIIASNSSWTATPPTDGVQLRALDYAEALNEDPDSIYYKRLDLDRIGAMGHSQGASATVTAASDPRIKALILWNGGTSDDKPFLNVSGERDIDKELTPEIMAEETAAASQPGAWLYYKQVLQTGGASTGHLVLMEQPERVADMAVAWWQYMLNDDPDAKQMFVGDDCGMCDEEEAFAYGANNLPD